MLNLLIAGDFCPVKRAEKLLSNGEAILDPELSEFWNRADYRIANLECPLTDSSQQIIKNGPALKASMAASNGLKHLNFNALSLANNHIMDYGIQGLEDTCSMLEQEGISYFGINRNGKELPSYTIDKNGIKIGVLAYSIAEFTLAEDFNGNGARGIDIIRILNDLENLRPAVDHIIILLHMGLYLLPLPSPKQAEICRFLARQKGVKAVLCQHSHIVGSFEWLNDCFISYGQGSYLFDLNKSDSHWNKGYIVSLKFTLTEVTTDIIGTVQFNNDTVIRKMSSKEQESMMNDLEELNKALKDSELLTEKFQQSAVKKRNGYYGMMLLPPGRYFSALSRRVNLGKLIPKKVKITLLNLYRNEEHNEIIQEIIKQDIK